MAAALNHCESMESLIPSMCLLINIVPQNHRLNCGVFQIFEAEIFSWSRQAPLHLVTGPLWMVEDPNGSLVPCDAACRDVSRNRFKTVGANKLLVPTHIFKIVRIMENSFETTGIFIFPNEEVPLETPIASFLQPLTTQMSNLAVVNKATQMDWSPYFAATDRNIADLLKVRPSKPKVDRPDRLVGKRPSEMLEECYAQDLSSMFPG